MVVGEFCGKMAEVAAVPKDANYLILYSIRNFGGGITVPWTIDVKELGRNRAITNQQINTTALKPRKDISRHTLHPSQFSASREVISKACSC